MTEPKYLIIKRGWYYRPNSSGYTGIKDEAGRYSLTEVAVRFPKESESGLSHIHENDAPEYTTACFYEVKLRHQRDKAERLLRAVCEAWVGGSVPPAIQRGIDYLGTLNDR